MTTAEPPVRAFQLERRDFALYHLGVNDANELSQLREEIDRLDDQIIELVAERMRVAIRIGELKRKTGLPIYDPERERAIYQRLCGKAPKPATPDIVRRIFERLIDESRRAEQRAERE